MEPKRKHNKPGLRLYYLVLSLIALLLLIMVAFLRDGSSGKPVETAGPADPPGVTEYYPGVPETPDSDKTIPQQLPVPERGGRPAALNPGAVEKPPVKDRGTLVFVIDDVGNNLEQLDNFLKFPGPITFAVMPRRTYTAEAVKRIKAAGKSVILHQPMEPLGDADPGVGAVTVSMTREEIWATLDENLKSTGPVIGMNNHMGSRATSDPETMKSVLAYLEKKGMGFLDSATTADLVGAPLAEQLGVVYTKRNSMFLDNESDRQSIYDAIKAGEATAAKKGHAIMIGHVMTDELAKLLFELYPTFIEDGFTVKDLSDLLHGEFDAGSWD